VERRGGNCRAALRAQFGHVTATGGSPGATTTKDYSTFDLTSERFSVNPYYWKQNKAQAAEAWKGKIISGRITPARIWVARSVPMAATGAESSITSTTSRRSA
jgi:hypothetical protein